MKRAKQSGKRKKVADPISVSSKPSKKKQKKSKKKKSSYKIEAALLRVRLEERDEIIRNQKELIAHLSSVLQSLGTTTTSLLQADSLGDDSDEQKCSIDDPKQPPCWSQHVTTAESSAEDQTQEEEDGFEVDLRWDEEDTKKPFRFKQALQEHRQSSSLHLKGVEAAWKDNDCGMCRLDIEPHELLYKLHCGHQFHLLCVAKCVGSRSIENKCATCFAEFLLEECKEIEKCIQQMKREERENQAEIRKQLRAGAFVV